MSGSDVMKAIDRNDAEDYVESIMASERVVKVDTPTGNGRKRYRSAGGISQVGSHEKLLVSPGDSDQSYSFRQRENKTKKARRAVIGRSPPSESGRRQNRQNQAGGWWLRRLMCMLAQMRH